MRPALLPIEGFPGRTLLLPGSDLPQSVPYNDLRYFGQHPIGAIVTTEYAQGNGIRFTFGQGLIPSPAGIGHILLGGQILYLTNPSQVERFQFTNYFLKNNSNVTITLLYVFEVIV